jgi:hypothetical protein
MHQLFLFEWIVFLSNGTFPFRMERFPFESLAAVVCQAAVQCLQVARGVESVEIATSQLSNVCTLVRIIFAIL